jgi:hypothetical protein
MSVFFFEKKRAGDWSETGDPRPVHTVVRAYHMPEDHVLAMRMKVCVSNEHEAVHGDWVPEDESFVAHVNDKNEAMTACVKAAAAWHDRVTAAIPRPPKLAWGYSTSKDPEEWQSADTREEAIALARQQAVNERSVGGPGEAWIVGGVYEGPVGHTMSFEMFVDAMEQSAADNGLPDGMDEGFTFAEGAEAAYDAMMTAWTEKYVRATWWTQDGEPEEVTVPSESPAP